LIFKIKGSALCLSGDKGNKKQQKGYKEKLSSKFMLHKMGLYSEKSPTKQRVFSMSLNFPLRYYKNR
jgi:hypothetical protein